MSLFIKILERANNSFARFLFTLLNCLLIWYFSWQSAYSNKGYINYLKAKDELHKRKEEFDSLIFEKLEVSKKISLINDSSIDKDMLDEIARSKLGLSHKDERVIIFVD